MTLAVKVALNPNTTNQPNKVPFYMTGHNLLLSTILQGIIYLTMNLI